MRDKPGQKEPPVVFAAGGVMKGEANALGTDRLLKGKDIQPDQEAGDIATALNTRARGQMLALRLVQAAGAVSLTH